MKTLYLAGALLSGVLAVAPTQADQCAKVGAVKDDPFTLTALSGISCSSKVTLSRVPSAGPEVSRPFGRSFIAQAPTDRPYTQFPPKGLKDQSKEAKVEYCKERIKTGLIKSPADPLYQQAIENCLIWIEQSH